MPLVSITYDTDTGRIVAPAGFTVPLEQLAGLRDTAGKIKRALLPSLTGTWVAPEIVPLDPKGKLPLAFDKTTGRFIELSKYELRTILGLNDSDGVNGTIGHRLDDIFDTQLSLRSPDAAGFGDGLTMRAKTGITSLTFSFPKDTGAAETQYTFLKNGGIRLRTFTPALDENKDPYNKTFDVALHPIDGLVISESTDKPGAKTVKLATYGAQLASIPVQQKRADLYTQTAQTGTAAGITGKTPEGTATFFIENNQLYTFINAKHAKADALPTAMAFRLGEREA